MALLSTIIYGWEPFLLFAIVGIPIAFITSLPSVCRNWFTYSRNRRIGFTVYGSLAAVCIVTMIGLGRRAIHFAVEEGREQSKRRAQNQLSFVNHCLSIYYVDYGEYPKGTVAEVWNTISQTEHFRSTKQNSWSDELRADAAGILIDPWDSSIRFRLESDELLRAYSAGPDRVFSTVDDLPEKWERTNQRSQADSLQSRDSAG